ncbi:MAG: FeoA family protein [Xenococcaceae cyanobacterium MO_167.B52]|nr:FeoA family protein [Xenococcaceae cyanobacterium MO_167.B52]
MDDDHRNRKQRHRKGQSLQFTFVGGTPERLSKEQNQPKFVPDLTQHQLKEEPVFPLSHTQIGDLVVITQILSGKSLIYRLSQMGLIIGSEIQVISKTKSGSVIVGIQDQQVGLGAGMANQVMVTLATGRI